MSFNDAIDVVCYNLNEEPLRLDFEALSKLAKGIERLCQLACDRVEPREGNAILQLVDVQRGSLRFRFHLDIHVVSSGTRKSSASKDGVTRTSEVLGILSFLIMIAGPTPAQAPFLDEHAQLQLNEAKGLLEKAPDAITSLCTSAMKAGCDRIDIQIRDSRISLLGPERPVLARTWAGKIVNYGRPEEGRIEAIDPEPIPLSIDGREVTAFRAAFIPPRDIGDAYHRVLVVFPDFRLPTDGALPTLVRAVDPTAVRLLRNERFKLNEIDGILVVLHHERH